MMRHVAYLFLMAAATVAAQQPFALDTTFRTTIVDQNVNAVHLLEDGKIFLSGRIRFPGELVVRSTARLYPDGQPDLPFASQYGGGGKIVPWQDGKFYVGAGGLARRRLADGSIDLTFIAMYNSPYFSAGNSGDFHVFPDGRVLLSGSSHTLSDTVRGFVGNYDLIWFSNEGYLDTTRTHRNGNGAVYRFAELANGKFICNGTGSTFEGVPVDRIFRVHADGAPDTTFNTGVFIGSAYAYLPLPDGRVYVGGNFRRSAAPNDTLRLVRFMPDGSLDPTFDMLQFNAGQELSTTVGATVHGLRSWDHGKLIVTGQFVSVNGQPRRGICMIDTSGQLLDTFDDCGVWPVTQAGGITNAGILGVLPTPDSTHLYVWGTYVGYDDGTTNDMEQRFVSRLHLGDISTGVQDVEEPPLRTLTAHPNPADTWVALNHHVPGNTGALTLAVRDMTGRLLHTITTGGPQGQSLWDSRNVLPGVYTVELQNGHRTLGTVRVVIQR
jgi:uncharacterized delta-60 repeat protein